MTGDRDSRQGSVSPDDAQADGPAPAAVKDGGRPEGAPAQAGRRRAPSPAAATRKDQPTSPAPAPGAQDTASASAAPGNSAAAAAPSVPSAAAPAAPPDGAPPAPATPPARGTALTLREQDRPAPPPGVIPTPPAGTPDPALAHEEALGIEALRAFDRAREAMLGRLTGGASPASLGLAITDWAMHLGFAPGKQAELMIKAARKASRLGAWLTASALDPDLGPAIRPLPGDRRFVAEGWQKPPFSWMSQAFLFTQQWWHNVTHEVPGVTPHHEAVVSFAARQALDMMAPTNFPATNPEVLERTMRTGGMNLVQGWSNWIEDMSRRMTGDLPVGCEAFRPGHEVAITPGKVIFRNHLIELIQYAPLTPQTRPEPVLTVPAWIMKYYILDLRPENSTIRWLVQQGYTVFAISWRNPGAEDRDLGLEDYRRLGVMAALDAVGRVCPDRKVHAVGYCLGGTLLSIAATAMAQAGDDRLGTVTLLAAQTDFTEPGELQLFIDHSQLRFLDSIMWDAGYLSERQMAGAFKVLRSSDLIWSQMVHDYLMGERAPMTDLMAWNADSTRMPYRMHSEYLHQLYLDNALASGRYLVEGRPLILHNLQTPLFVVATERDHVAPWTSVYKIHLLVGGEVTFVLASGGHNVGIVNPPDDEIEGHFRIATRPQGAMELHHADWARVNPPREGSWWTAWTDWLAAHSGAPGDPPGMGAPDLPPLADAPGSYVLMR